MSKKVIQMLNIGIQNNMKFILYLPKIFLLSLFFITSIYCSNSNYFISDIYFNCVNPEIFDDRLEEGKFIYPYNSQKSNILLLTLNISLSNSIFLPFDNGKYDVHYYFKVNNGVEKEIKDFKNTRNEKIVDIEDNNVKINISKIDILGDYTITAYANSKKTDFVFSVDSDENIANNISIFYVNGFDNNLNDTSLISNKLKKNLELSTSSLYALCCRSNCNLGALQFNVDYTDNLKVINVADVEKNYTTSENYGNLCYLLASGKPNSKAKLTISAGNKKEENFFINIEKIQNRLIGDSPPLSFLSPIENGYRLICKMSQAAIEKNFSIMLNINNDDDNIKCENKYYENGNFCGYYYDITNEGNYTINTYYIKGNLITESYPISFSINKDNILQKLDSSDFIEIKNHEQNITSFDDNPIIKTIKIKIPPLNDYKENIPNSTPTKSFSLYEKVKPRIEIIGDETHIIEPEYDWQKGYTKTIDIYNNTSSDNTIIKIKIPGVLSRVPGDERIFIIPNENQSNICNLEFDGTAYDSANNAMALFSLNFSSELTQDSTLYYSYSEDNGKTFSAIRKKGLSKGTTKISFSSPDKQYFDRENSVFRVVISQLGKRLNHIGYIYSGNLKIAPRVNIDTSDSIQDFFNARVARIAFSSSNYTISFAITDDENADGNNLPYTKIYESPFLVMVVKATNTTQTNTLSKYLWIKVENKNDKTVYPFTQRQKVTLYSAYPAITENNKEAVWKNEGMFGRGICLFLTSPMDNCYVRVISDVENEGYDGIHFFSTAGEKALFGSDWDMCLAGYRHNRFAIASFTRKVGYMDSPINEYCGGCRSSSKTHNDDALEHMETLRKEWRCVYVR